MQIEFMTVDVFTDRRFGGNPLAVVPDAAPLDSALMQAIAAEFNLAENTFVLPPRDAAHTAEVRIFTPRAESPFAGHPKIDRRAVDRWPLRADDARHARAIVSVHAHTGRKRCPLV
jgi:PhzF family phenazine biosynthesis protein